MCGALGKITDIRREYASEITQYKRNTGKIKY